MSELSNLATKPRLLALLAVVAAAVAGLAGYATGLPGGPLVAAMIAAALVARLGPIRMPALVGDGARWLVGAVAGSLVTREALGALGPQVAWGAAASVLTIIVGVVGGVWAARVTGLDRGTSVVAVVPGGLSELTGLANELDLRTDVVIAVHLVRRIAVVVIAVTLIVPFS